MLYCKIMCIMCLRYKQLNYLKNNLYSSFIFLSLIKVVVI
mgnify:CR=1 FL=1